MKMTLDTGKMNLDLGVLEVEIVGVATVAAPLIGRMLIIHCPEIRNETYDYEYLSVPEIFLTNPDAELLKGAVEDLREALEILIKARAEKD